MDHEHDYQPTEAEVFQARLQTLVSNLTAVGNVLAVSEKYSEAGVCHAGAVVIADLYARLRTAEQRAQQAEAGAVRLSHPEDAESEVTGAATEASCPSC